MLPQFEVTELPPFATCKRCGQEFYAFFPKGAKASERQVPETCGCQSRPPEAGKKASLNEGENPHETRPHAAWSEGSANAALQVLLDEGVPLKEAMDRVCEERGIGPRDAFPLG